MMQLPPPTKSSQAADPATHGWGALQGQALAGVATPSAEYEMVFTDEPESEEVSQPDIVILVMGPTGAGKSSFINHLVGEERAKVGHGLVSCTYQIDVIRYVSKDGAPVVLIDTPGFNDTNVTDFAILVLITDWLTATYKQKVTLSGVLYFHRITDNRMTGPLLHNLEMFKSMVGEKAFFNVSLVTTMWDAVTESMATVHEQQLRTQYWKGMIRNGSRVRRHDNTPESALKIISEFRACPNPTSLLVQHEIVDLNKSLPETTVGRRFKKWLEGLIHRFKRNIVKLWWVKASPEMIMKEKVQLDDAEQLNKTNWIQELRRPSTPSTITSASCSSITIEEPEGEVPPSPVLPLPPRSSVINYSSHDILQSTIFWLRHANSLATLGPVPGLRELVNLALVVATAVEKYWACEDSLVLLSQNVSWFILGITDHASKYHISDELISFVASFTRDLERVQGLIQDALRQPGLKRYMLSDKEKQLVETCNQAILNSTQMLQIRIGLQNHQAIQMMGDRLLSVLHNGFGQLADKLDRHMFERSNTLLQVPPTQVHVSHSQAYEDWQASDDAPPPPSPVLCCLHPPTPGHLVTRRNTI
ncbi:hypothetical protein CVT24_011717 [Panaeolus cyanescens]|uniref:G domain-containing protein n=1 Tax=Panaeolus cyanescens TaxID=181874 RepID=A0A409WQ78_9AGAR|nr:hypothetical protein CVT24_011717 [Panaeolus cyanescens]